MGSSGVQHLRIRLVLQCQAGVYKICRIKHWMGDYGKHKDEYWASLESFMDS